jgi:broad specificity phosphatase PhoE
MTPVKTGEECVRGARHEEQIRALEASDRDQWQALNDCRDKLAEAQVKFEQALREVASRLPNWATALLTAMGMLIGALVALAARRG